MSAVARIPNDRRIRTLLTATAIGLIATAVVAMPARSLAARSNSRGSSTTPAIRVAATLEGGRVVVGRRTVIAIRLRNTTGRRLSKLELGESIVIDGNPDAVPGTWRPRLSDCGGAAGTVYCSLPALAPHASLTTTLTFVVPRKFGGPGTALAGKPFRFFVFVVHRGRTDSGSVRINRTIIAAHAAHESAGQGRASRSVTTTALVPPRQ
jgi:hypothetical protein